MRFVQSSLILFLILIPCFSSFAGQEFENKLKEITNKLIYSRGPYKEIDEDKIVNLLEQLNEISKRENVNIVESLNSRTYRTYGYEYPLIYWASYDRMIKIIKYLVELGANPNPIIQQEKASSLMYNAIIWGYFPVVRLLIESGVSPTDIDVTEKPPPLLGIARKSRFMGSF